MPFEKQGPTEGFQSRVSKLQSGNLDRPPDGRVGTRLGTD